MRGSRAVATVPKPVLFTRFPLVSYGRFVGWPAALKRRVQRVELRLIEEVERIGAELQHRMADQRHVLLDREVQIVDGRQRQEVARRLEADAASLRCRSAVPARAR